MIPIIYWIGAILGIIGVTLVAFRHPWIGHIVFVPTNICIVIAAYANGQTPMVIMMSYYLLIAIIGSWKWRPLKLNCQKKWRGKRDYRRKKCQP